MIRVEIILLTNNIVIPFQNIRENHFLDFIELNKLFASKSLAEHGLGFLINVYDVVDTNNPINAKLLKKIVFDTGGTNHTYLHNLDIRGYPLYDVDYIVLSHWHYDHTGGLFKILERIDNKVPIICHESAKFERFFKRVRNLKNEDLVGKKRTDLLPLLSSLKIISQEPINIEQIKKLKGEVHFTKDSYEILNVEGLKILSSGEIPRNHIEEDFTNFFSLQEGTLKIDKILDDKCLILEFEENIILLNGCCHSGLMNTLDYVRIYSDKPISHIIGGFHMAGASDKRIKITLEYLNSLEMFNNTLYLFPIHCSGEKFIKMANANGNDRIKAFNPSVGTTFYFKGII
ncbi:MAG: MBL fold metallo-hydrolase [Candidatus Lokiarchaeota archaeon]|nr:MBL fold metallo-hydrolase [Candidatus Lokiarchaeota archaeon]